jgi:hypothetical protein
MGLIESLMLARFMQVMSEWSIIATQRKELNMKTYIVLATLLAFATANARAQSYYFDSLVRDEVRDQPSDAAIWHFNYQLNTVNFILSDEWSWLGENAEGKIDARNYTITLSGHNDRQVSVAEFRSVFAADMARADTILYNYRLFRATKDMRLKSQGVIFERAYETAYVRDEKVAAIVAR